MPKRGKDMCEFTKKGRSVTSYAKAEDSESSDLKIFCVVSLEPLDVLVKGALYSVYSYKGWNWSIILA